MTTSQNSGTAKVKSPVRFYYITHVSNLPSILQEGILSHSEVEKRNLNSAIVYNADVVNRRRENITPDDRSLWEYANVYINARNPMLYRVSRQTEVGNLCILVIDAAVMNLSGAFLTDGNAASTMTKIRKAKDGIPYLDWNVLDSDYWTEYDDGTRRIMAECLIPKLVEPKFIKEILVSNSKHVPTVRQLISSVPRTINIIPEPYMFFQPRRSSRVADRISILDGDMFFSQMQTLTISVNTVGVMGKGLASRAKYQFPDVYVVYQSVCDDKTLKLGSPYLFKRQKSVDLELADDPQSLYRPNDTKWFLLFATKGHFRESSKLIDIEHGMQWLVQNAEHEGIESIALPALGCGLGGLPWSSVGPLMCRYLSQLNIKSAIYLPREQNIPDDQMNEAFLLG